MENLNKHGSAAYELLYNGADQVLRSLEDALPADVLSDFIQSVTWREPFILALLGTHVVLWVFAVHARRSDVAQFILVAMLCGIALNARRLNAFGKANWDRFATQDYFDSNGTFLLIFVLGPFVLLANFIVVRVLFCFESFICALSFTDRVLAQFDDKTPQGCRTFESRANSQAER